MDHLFSLLSFGSGGWGDEILAGTWLTVRLALATVPFGLVLGFLIALAKRSSNPVISGIGTVYTTVFRGLPELLTLFIVYYGVQMLLQDVADMVTPGVRIEISAFLAGMFALGLVFAAFSSEVFAGAFRGIGGGQWEAASALGLSRRSTLLLVIIPQLARLSAPGIGNLWMSLLKDTSLVSVIALNDLLRETQVAVGVTKEPFFFFAVACGIYLVLSIISTAGLMRIEAWADKPLKR